MRPERATVGILPLADGAKGGGMLPLVIIRPKYTAKSEGSLLIFRAGALRSLQPALSDV